MAREKTCIDSGCRSDEQHRIAHSQGLCRNCYMRRWRAKKVTTRSKEETTKAAAHADLKHYLRRHQPALRLLEVQKLLDSGSVEEEIVSAFLHRPDLLE